MTQGIFLRGRRPKSKKEIKEAVAAQEYGDVELEATSVFGNEYGGNLRSAPDGTYTFVGPDPYRSRKFYGQIVKRDGKVVVK